MYMVFPDIWDGKDYNVIYQGSIEFLWTQINYLSSWSCLFTCDDYIFFPSHYDSAQFNHSFMSNSLWLQGLQQARLPCPSSTPRAYSGSKLMSIESVNSSNHLILCHPLLLLPSIFPCIRVFFKESVLCIRWLKYWSFSLSISPSKEYSGLISFRMDWLDFLAAQGTLKSILQHQSSKPSTQISLESNSHIYTWLLENHSFD